MTAAIEGPGDNAASTRDAGLPVAHALHAFGWAGIAGQMLGFYDWLLAGARGAPATPVALAA